MNISVSDLACDLHSAQFKLHLPSNASCSDVNRLRRIMMKEVPTWAIHSVNIQQNTSTCYNEILSHRLTLVPVVWEGPNDSDLTDTFELFCVGDNLTLITTEHLRSYNSYVKPVYPDMVLCHLKKGESIRLTAELQCGTGSQSAKWSPVTNVTYELDREAQSSIIYKMHLESVGGMSPSEIIEKAVAIYNKSC